MIGHIDMEKCNLATKQTRQSLYKILIQPLQSQPSMHMAGNDTHTYMAMTVDMMHHNLGAHPGKEGAAVYIAPAQCTAQYQLTATADALPVCARTSTPVGFHRTHWQLKLLLQSIHCHTPTAIMTVNDVTLGASRCSAPQQVRSSSPSQGTAGNELPLQHRDSSPNPNCNSSLLPSATTSTEDH
jgi:hypothetical protein